MVEKGRSNICLLGEPVTAKEPQGPDVQVRKEAGQQVISFKTACFGHGCKLSVAVMSRKLQVESSNLSI